MPFDTYRWVLGSPKTFSHFFLRYDAKSDFPFIDSSSKSFQIPTPPSCEEEEVAMSDGLVETLGLSHRIL